MSEEEPLNAADISDLHKVIYNAFEEQKCDADKVETALKEFNQDRNINMMITVDFNNDPGRCVIINNGTVISGDVISEAETLTTTHRSEDGSHSAEIRSLVYNRSIIGVDRRYQILRSIFFDRDGAKDELMFCGEIFDYSHAGPKGEDVFFCSPNNLSESIDVSFHDGIVEIWFDDMDEDKIQIFSIEELKDHINKRKVM